MAATATPPEQEQHHSILGPTLPPSSYSTTLLINQSPPSKLPIDFSPPLIAMVVVAAAAFLFITYSRLISRHLFPPFLRFFRRHRRRRRFFPPSDIGSPPPPYESSDGFYVYSPYGLDESVIKNIPLTIYKFPTKLGFIEVDGFHDCAVCLLEFEEGESMRTLPLCCHSFHVDCIDMWLRSHATCPLCRAGVYLSPPMESPMSPVMAARIRPSFDEGILLESMFLEPLPECDDVEQNSGEIEEIFSPERRIIQSEDHRSNRRELDFLLKRSYSFGFERSFPSERLVMEPATTPYHHRQRRSFFWSKRLSSTPFKSRVFSFRRNIKSPAFFRRRGFFPLSESSASLRYASTDESCRRMKALSLQSPLFGRPSMFSSSRMRSGDPEALISPERYNRR